jgi:hypothetical protein
MNSYTLPIQIDLPITADFLLALFGKSPSHLFLEIRPLRITVHRGERCFFSPRLLQKTGFHCIGTIQPYLLALKYAPVWYRRLTRGGELNEGLYEHHDHAAAGHGRQYGDLIIWLSNTIGKTVKLGVKLSR